MLHLQQHAGNRAAVAAMRDMSVSAPKAPRSGRPATRIAPKRVQRKERSSSVVKLSDAGVSVTSAVGSFNQVGHAMDIWADIDVGKNPVAAPTARSNSIYGLELEYWEWIDVPQDNQGGMGVKPWNDIYAIKPDAGTFNRAAGGCDLTWKQAVDQATAKTLRGKHRIGFQDVPGLIPKPGRDVKRTLKFRIVLTDGEERREIFATQRLEMGNGEMGYAAYTDSVGNNVETHGYGRHDYDANQQREADELDRRNDRLSAAQLPRPANVLQAIPAEAKQRVQSFVVSVVKGGAAPYVDLELAQILKAIPATTPNRGVAQKQTAGRWATLAAELAGDI
ncbi:MAG TPA: hypothetical protein VKV06_14750, partial [Acidimicrobiales bacterium]|nr:hypothetical protein [Acidimicrobiales bacterium]